MRASLPRETVREHLYKPQPEAASDFEAGGYEPSASGNFSATSQIWPSGSVKLAVRIPHSRFIGPLSSVTPFDASSAQTASASSTPIVSWKRDPEAAPAAVDPG